MRRTHQIILICSTILFSWLGMQAIHELGHVLGGLLTSGKIKQVVLHPLTISRTDLAENPSPLLVVWAGPVFGCLAPVSLYLISIMLRMPGAFVLRFFAGFCLIANGAYLGVGSFDQVGDCGEMLKHGSQTWHLWLFGVIVAPLGLWLWHGQGVHFGLGKANGAVNPKIAYGVLLAAILLLVNGLAVGGE